jgi:hypothetical protein
MNGEEGVMKNESEGRTSGPVQVSYRHLPEGTEEIHEKPQPRLQISLPGFEPITSAVRVYSLISNPIQQLKPLHQTCSRQIGPIVLPEMYLRTDLRHEFATLCPVFSFAAAVRMQITRLQQLL